MRFITSLELNYLIFRYLQESGFLHSAFTLGYEAGLNTLDFDGNLVPPGALVSFMQKGLQYLEMEANLNDEGDIEGDFSLLEPLELLTKNVHELRQLVKERRKEKEMRDKDKGKDRKGKAKIFTGKRTHR